MRALLLDIGGVFYLSNADEAFFARWAPRCGLPPAELQRQFWFGPDIERANVGALEAEDYYVRAGARLGLEAALVREMCHEAFIGEFNHAFAAYVRAARARGRAVAALTNSWSSEAALMARPELAGLFDFAVSSRDVGLVKPDPAIYRLALARIDRPAAEVIFVDDTPACVDAAQALGIAAVQFIGTEQTIAALGPFLA